MGTQQIIENNKLIAEFMGIPSYEYRGYTMFVFDDNNHRTDVDLHYHNSWDWLMPVVKKCYEYGQLASDERTDLHLCLLKYKHKCNIEESLLGIIDIESTHKAVVEFIKWYNENKGS